MNLAIGSKDVGLVHLLKHKMQRSSDNPTAWCWRYLYHAKGRNSSASYARTTDVHSEGWTQPTPSTCWLGDRDLCDPDSNTDYIFSVMTATQSCLLAYKCHRLEMKSA